MNTPAAMLQHLEDKEAEIQALEAQITELRGYIKGIRYALGSEPARLNPSEATSQPKGNRIPMTMQPDSLAGRAHAVLLENGKPMHCDKIAKAIGELDRKRTLSSVMRTKAKEKKVFTLGKQPNTFGLIEFKKEETTPDKQEQNGAVRTPMRI